MAGSSLDLFRGANQAEVLTPGLSSSSSILGQFGFQTMLVTFFAIGGHIVFLEALFYSFELFSPTQIIYKPKQTITILDMVIRLTTSIIPLAFSLVFPGLLSAVIVDIVFGLLNKITPQLNAYFMSLSVKALVVVIILLASIPTLQQLYQNQWQKTVQTIHKGTSTPSN